MKKICILALMAGGLSLSTVYADDSKVQNNPLSPVGYWVQYDEDSDAGKGMANGILQSYIADDGTVGVKIVVPLMIVDRNSGKVRAPLVNCEICGKGSINGFTFNYTDSKDNFLQGLQFAGHNTIVANSNTAHTGYVYDNGGVLNPNDGKVYNGKIQVRDDGETMFARAYKGSGWATVGKDAHWKRIDKAAYEKAKAECGLTVDNVYPYQTKDGTITNNDLYKKCTNYSFDVKKPF